MYTKNRPYLSAKKLGSFPIDSLFLHQLIANDYYLALNLCEISLIIILKPILLIFSDFIKDKLDLSNSFFDFLFPFHNK